MDKRKRYYFPYCWDRMGFCLKNGDCTRGVNGSYDCSFFRARHPITKLPPQMLLPKEAV